MIKSGIKLDLKVVLKALKTLRFLLKKSLWPDVLTNCV